jgi:hypothetical protein
MTRKFVLGTLLAAGALSMTVAAFQPPAAPAPMVVEAEKLKDNLWVMKGGGGNSAVFLTAEGVTVVDTKLPGWGKPLLDKIKTVTDKPVMRIINTHTHFDHVSGNVEFPATVEVVTHENTKMYMDQANPVYGVQTGPAAQPVQAERRQGDAEADLQGQDDDRPRRGPDRSLLLRPGAHGRRRLRSVPVAAPDARRRYDADARHADHGQEQRRQRRWSSRRRSRRRRRSAASTRSSTGTTRRPRRPPI